eukprot:1195794-Prorocentrum_minimum.AAC.2
MCAGRWRGARSRTLGEQGMAAVESLVQEDPNPVNPNGRTSGGAGARARGLHGGGGEGADVGEPRGQRHRRRAVPRGGRQAAVHLWGDVLFGGQAADHPHDAAAGALRRAAGTASVTPPPRNIPINIPHQHPAPTPVTRAPPRHARDAAAGACLHH